MMFLNRANASKVKVKICGITSLSMAEWVLAQGADAIGFVFYPPSPRNITIERAAEIAQVIANQIDVIGVFVNATQWHVEQILAHVPLTGMQFHGDESTAFCARWSLPWLKAIRVDAKCNLEKEVLRWKDAFSCLLDVKCNDVYGGSGKTFDWSIIPSHIRPNIVLSGGINSTNVRKAIKSIKPLGIDVSSGVECVKGEKSKLLIKQFMWEVHDGQSQ